MFHKQAFFYQCFKVFDSCVPADPQVVLNEFNFIFAFRFLSIADNEQDKIALIIDVKLLGGLIH